LAYHRKQTTDETLPRIGGETSLNGILKQRNSSSLDPQPATAAFPSLTSYAAARALTAINDARPALQKAA